MKKIPVFLILLLILSSCSRKMYESAGVNYTNYPKREFRGVWISTAWTDIYRKQTTEQNKEYLRRQLDIYQDAGINAVIFQVRPQADAFYKSDIEPWSHYLTGKQGTAPSPYWDPMAFLIEECHKRNMEFHAWLNPYRVTTADIRLADNHIYHQHPEYFVKYGKHIYFQPAEPWSRKYICDLVKDIVARYDVDGIHMDDYFYPYPIAGEQFPDLQCFMKYAAKQGFKADQVADWRRYNVNLLIEQLSFAIKSVKPWVKFGIAPFGIYRNKKDTPDGSGSNTNGLSNYHDLYADVQLWAKQGWVDYTIPQVYWEMGHKAADYTTLVDWWSENMDGKTLYIGQCIERTANRQDPVNPDRTQLTRKMEQVRKNKNIDGNCFWYGNLIMENTGGIRDSMKNYYHRFPAFVPVIKDMDDDAPDKVKKLKAEWKPDGYFLQWREDNEKSEMNKQAYYCIYRFKEGDRIDLDNPSKIMQVTRANDYKLPYKDGKTKYIYIVTAFDRLHNESKGRKIHVKL